ncbi:penicillin-binding transpeptidase domain-containing protein [Actinocorallia sp. A-T 12471]|uniref:penicillin-binding transpeptidase domain-containing protein n=1 Tax=Actinocorallia sp. A-T 12471 TaxID=3089813 RepID=UPI0029CEF706|nr:penicillin-binding transpeptidase domain-containing protein [Actinocorallia sp. A-T 12471]MDX6742993.1 penicillin-binding transpeptidase domain-containing protein [Actinocorallia sp. A-T 12471]
MRRKTVVLVAVPTVLAAAGAGLWALNRGDGPETVAARFAAAWQRQDAPAMAALAEGDPADLPASLGKTWTDLGVTAQTVRIVRVVDRDDVLARYQAELTLGEGQRWKYDGSFGLAKVDGDWKVSWAPDVLHPDLKDGQRLTAVRAYPDRAAITAANGSDLRLSSSGSVQQLIGPVGAATGKQAQEFGAPYREGDPVGQDGLNRQYDRRLAGTPGTDVKIVDADDKAVKTLASFDGTEGEPLETTIDPRVQRAAGEALTPVKKNASIVVVRPSTGEILAVANKPGGYNRALMGQYPPGSTFKIVTAAALVAGGTGVKDTVKCPATTTIGGRTFKNAGYEKLGSVPFRDAFAHSCNTTFASLAVSELGKDRLAQVAAQFGFNAPVISGLPSVRAAFPAVKDDTALAAAAFGQGEVLTSPLNMASVAAAAADGTWRSPRLVPADLVSEALDAGGKKAEPDHPLDPGVRRALRVLMPAVVTEGTAHAVAFPAGSAGKTGTAEYGSGENPPTHAWFVGYKGDVAFSVIVEDGGTGAEAAAPVAARFLNAL